MDVFISVLTNGKITQDKVGPHNDLLAGFPYVGPPHEDRSSHHRADSATHLAHPLALTAFGAILAEEIDWQPFPAFPPSARLAVVVGEPSEKGLYTVRVKVPNGVKLMPHRHQEDRVYTVISGIFYIGVGDRFDVGDAAGVSARISCRAAREHVALSLGEVGRIRDTSVRHGATRHRLRKPGRRSAPPQRIARAPSLGRKTFHIDAACTQTSRIRRLSWTR